MRTQVAIIGAGPAGLLLSHLLHRAGIASVVIERHSRRHAEERIRAGVLEQGTVDLLVNTGIGDRLRREGLVHDGIELRFGGRGHRVDFKALTGRTITVYGQHEVVKDLITARLAAGGQILFDSVTVGVHDFETKTPRIRFRQDGAQSELACDFIAGCDGFHGICRPSIPAGALTIYEKEHAFGWLGILAESPPPSRELIYAHHQRGFALYSMRTPQLSRLYLQCAPGEDPARWPDELIWKELRIRLGSGGRALREGLVVDDIPASQLSGSGATAGAPATGRARLHRRIPLRCDGAGRELRRPALR